MRSNVSILSIAKSACVTYTIDRQQDETGSGSFFGGVRIVDQRIDSRGSEYETSGQESSKGHMISVDSICADYPSHPNDAEQKVGQTPPGVVWVISVDVGDDRADEGDQPATLSYVSAWDHALSHRPTHNANAY